MLSKLIDASIAAENTAPVETNLSFDKNSVYIKQRLWTGENTLAYETAVLWREINFSRFDILEFHIRAGREALLSEWEGQHSTNPNREHT